MESVAPGYRPEVRLAPHAGVGVADGTLTIGLPFLMFLQRDELAALVTDAKVFAELDAHPSTRRARWLLASGLGGALRYRDGKDSRASRMLLHRIDVAAADFQEATHAWVDSLRGQRGSTWRQTAQVLDAVEESWQHVCGLWLAPAMAARFWHPEPFTGLRSFLTACESHALVTFDARPGGDPSITLLQDVRRYEADLASTLVDADELALEPTNWEEHPASVSVPRWRQTLAAALVAADRATGHTHPATLETILGLVEDGWADTLAAVLTSTPTEAGEEPTPVKPVLDEVLTAATSVALLDGGAGQTIWQWPFGTCLIDEQGRVLAVEGVVQHALAEFGAGRGLGALRDWLHAQGVGLEDPLWLGEGVAPDGEQSILAFHAYQGLRTAEAVLSTQALRLFPVTYAQGVRTDVRHAMDGTAFQERMSAVNAGDLEGQSTEVPLDDVVAATFGPMIGGHWWRLRITTSQGSTTIRGNGPGLDIAEEFAARLGDRLHRPWLRRPGWLLRVRNVIGFAGLGFGMLALIMLVWALVAPASHMRRSDAPVFLVVAAVCLLIGMLPDLVANVLERLDPRQRARREPWPPTSL